MRNFDKEIQQKTSEAEDLIRKIKREIATIAEEGRTTAYWGEYGEIVKLTTQKDMLKIIKEIVQ